MRCAQCGGPLEARVLRVRPTVVLALLALTVVSSGLFFGTVLHDVMEGMERRRLLDPPRLIPVIAAIATILAWTTRHRGQACPTCTPERSGWLLVPLSSERAARLVAMPARRRLLRHGLSVVAATVVTGAGAFGAALFRNRGWPRVGRNIFVGVETKSPVWRTEWKGAQVRRYRRLGRTEAMVSDISLGSANIRSVEVARLAIDRGITYFDTSPDYSHHGSEELLGQAMQGRRDRMFVASKFCMADGHLPPDAPVPQIIEAVEGSLRRLRTDHLDLAHIHSCDRLERLLAPNLHEAFDRLKAAGKVRFLGVSTHTPNLNAVANAAIDSGRFDVLMLAYHFGMGWDLEHVIKKAAERDVAVVAMKTLKGAKQQNLDGFRQEGGSYTQAAFRWVLSNPAVSCLVVSFSEPQHVDEYLYASGTELTQADHAVLARYDALIAGDYCRPHCGACLDSCPAELPINDVLRYKMYFEDYRNEKEAMRKYARLGAHNAAVCAACPAPCAGTCPYDVPIREKMMAAHARLTLA